MNEEEVRQKMLDIVGDIYNAHAVATAPWAPFTFDGLTWKEAKDMINKAFDNLAVVRQKVKLPREVGEELEDWKKSNFDENLSGYIEDVDAGLDDVEKAMGWIYHRDDTSEQKRTELYGILADAYRYGWEAEPEAKWYVQTPKEWWEDSAIPEWMHFDTCRGVCSGFSKLGRTSFTSAELKRYHLDSDIFTLLPVEEEK